MESLTIKIEAVVIGGSAGSLPVILQVISELPAKFSLPVIVVIHRQRTGISELKKILQNSIGGNDIIEPEDKESIQPGAIYIAPQNYHLLIEQDYTFSLDYSEPVKYSRPSIDVTFESAARVYKNRLAGIILSGANNDGTAGLHAIVAHGGIAISQHPTTAQYPSMPQAAINAVEEINILDPGSIIQFLKDLAKDGK